MGRLEPSLAHARDILLPLDTYVGEGTLDPTAAIVLGCSISGFLAKGEMGGKWLYIYSTMPQVSFLAMLSAQGPRSEVSYLAPQTQWLLTYGLPPWRMMPARRPACSTAVPDMKPCDNTWSTSEDSGCLLQMLYKR